MDQFLVALGGAVKVLENDPGVGSDYVTVGGYSISFGSPQRRDLYRQYFDKRTYLGAHAGDGMDTYVHHGQVLRSSKTTKEELEVLKKYAGRRLAPTRTVVDEVGVLAKTILDSKDEYEAMLAEMAQQGKLSYSTGALAHLFHVEDDGHIAEWIVGEHSLTPTPAEWRSTNIVLPLKSFAEACGGEIEMERRESGLAVFPGTGIPTKAVDAAKADAVRAQLLGGSAEASMTMAGIYELQQRLYWGVLEVVYGPNYDGKSSDALPVRMEKIQAYLEEFSKITLRFSAAGMAIAEMSQQEASELRAFVETTKAFSEWVRAGNVLNAANRKDIETIRELADGIITRSVKEAKEEDDPAKSASIKTLTELFEDFVRRYDSDVRDGIARRSTTKDEKPPADPVKIEPLVITPAMIFGSLSTTIQ